MSKHSNPTVIGAFVVGGVVLIAIAASLFGGGELLAKRAAYVAYFEEETKGLRVGANVLLNGVRVGYVSDIDLLVDEVDYSTLTRVTFDILPDTYIPVRNGKLVPGEDIDSAITHEELIYEAGLRAQLEIESFITGQLLIRLDQRPETEPIMRGVESPHPEVPTIRSNIQELLSNIESWLANARENIDIEALGDGLAGALQGISELSQSDDLHEAIAGLNRLLNDEDTQQLSGRLNVALKDIGDAARQARILMDSADENIDTLSADLKPVLENLNDTLVQMESALAAASIQLRGDTQEIQQVQSTLKELERAASAVRQFFDLIERDPQSLIRGKQE